MVDRVLNGIDRKFKKEFIDVWTRRFGNREFAKRNKRGLRKLNKAIWQFFNAVDALRKVDKDLDRAYDKTRK